jgi:hypothetical protein
MKRNSAEDNKPVHYNSDDQEESEDENDNEDNEENEDNWAASTLAPVNNRSGAGVGGKQPVSAPNNTAAASKVPGRPVTAGKQPNVSAANIPAQTKPPSTGGKQPDLSPEKIAAMKKGATGGNLAAQSNKPPANSIAGKGPKAYDSRNNSKTDGGTTNASRPEQGGKQPQPRYQTSTSLSTSSHIRAKPQSSLTQARPQSHRKPHPLIGKMVKVFYVPEGYFTGLVKSQIGESEFMISWDDGSNASATLREDDETEDPDNEDRWSLVEDYEAPVNRVPEKPMNGGGRNQKPPPPKQQPHSKPPASQHQKRTAAQPKPAAAYQQDSDPENEENDPED